MRLLIAGFMLLAFCKGLSARAADSESGLLRWSTERVQANIQDVPMERVLKQLSDRTGWGVRVEPGLDPRVTVRFSDRTPAEALELLLRPANFSIRMTPESGTELLVFESDATKATKQIATAKRLASLPNRSTLIANELILTLKTNVSPEAIAGKVGARITGRIDSANAYRLEFDDADAASAARALLEADGSVDEVNSNYAIARPDAPLPAGGGSALPFTLSPSPGGDGSQLIVAVIDSAVQPLGKGLDAFLLDAISVESGYTPAASGEPGHGTSMAETILRGVDIATKGAESSVRVLPVDVYGSRETTSTFDLAWGISTAIESGARVINLSLGGDAPSSILETLIANSTANGVTFLAAAGNTPTTAPTYPAAYPQVVAVTAGSPGGGVADFANRGSFVDAVGPAGTLINYQGRTWMIGGTSPATAFLSGVTAGLASSSGTAPNVAVQSVVKQFPFKSALTE